MRRLLALLTSLSMLHLMLVGGDVACASHGAGGEHAMPGMTAERVSPTTLGLAPDAESDMTSVDTVAQMGTSCAAPSPNRCCEAMSSCGVTTTMTPAERLATGTGPVATAPRLASRVLASVRVAPEPPPPRA